jgi:AcrR family transcriptional regulator
MARPILIKDEYIINAARDVFLAHGIRATTSDVAARAGVSEGSIFKRFKTKYDLFCAAMLPEGVEPGWAKTVAARAGVGDSRENLVVLGMEIVDFFRRLMPLMMMAWSNRSDGGALPVLSAKANPPPLRTLKRLTAYFDAEMKQGRLRRHDPEIPARAFLGAVQSYVFFDTLMHEHNEASMPQSTFVRGLVGLIWDGLAPEGTATAKSTAGEVSHGPPRAKSKPVAEASAKSSPTLKARSPSAKPTVRSRGGR